MWGFLQMKDDSSLRYSVKRARLPLIKEVLFRNSVCLCVPVFTCLYSMWVCAVCVCTFLLTHGS